MTPKTPDSPSGPTLAGLADSYRRSLLAENKSAVNVRSFSRHTDPNIAAVALGGYSTT